jgi:death-on-curing protein
MAELRYLGADDVIALASEWFVRKGYAPPVLRDNGRQLLESGVMRAQTAAFYAQADLVEQAAALANGITLNHPFLDGNKRSAWIVTTTFLRVNGHPLSDHATDEFAEQLITQHEITDRSQADALLTEWLCSRYE